ncbi:MAG: Gfo/Idh/MocA family oxidoreductase [Pseudomonadota bacterium]
MSTSIGLVGCGRWGKHILRDLKSLGCDVSVVAKSPASIANATENNADKIVRDLVDLNSSIDGYVVATPTATHLDVVRSLAGRHKPIFVEKPLTDDVEGARSLARHAADQIFVMHKWRYHPGIQAMRDIQASGEFGPARGLRSVRRQWLSPHSDVDAIWILLPHDLSIVTHIFGSVPKPVHAHADPTGPLGCGLTADLICGDANIPIAIDVSASSPTMNREVSLGCQDAVISLCNKDYNTLEIRHLPQSAGADAPVEFRSLSDAMPLLAELEAFVSYLNGGPPPLTKFDTELQIIEVLSELRRMAGIHPKTVGTLS